MDTDNSNKTEQYWRFVADAIPILVFLVDQQGRIIRANRSLQRWGLGDVSTIPGRSLHDALHPACTTVDCYLRKFEPEILASISGGQRVRLEILDPVLERHLAFNIQPTEPDDEHLSTGDMRAVISVDDRSELKRSEEHITHLQATLHERIVQEMARRMEVEDVQARLLSILSKTPNLIAMTALDGSLLYINTSGRSLLQLEDEDIGELNLCDFMTPEANASLINEVLPAVLRDGVWTGPAALLASDGHRIPTTQVVIAHRDDDGKTEGFSFVEQDMSAWVLSETALRDSQEELRQLSSQLLNVQEDERRRISGDLHDVIGQALSLIKLSIDNAAQMLASGALEKAGKTLHELSAKVKETLVEVQRISMDLRPTTLDDLGILPTLSWFFREFEATCHNIRVSKKISVKEEDIPSLVKTTIFRLLQEATANIVKHSGADQIRVELSHQGDVLQLAVTDNGTGFDPGALPASDKPVQGLGLRSMKERARLSGGRFVLESTPGRGTSIRATWTIVSPTNNG